MDFNLQIINQRLQKLENLVKYLLTLKKSKGSKLAFFIRKQQAGGYFKGDVVLPDNEVLTNKYMRVFPSYFSSNGGVNNYEGQSYSNYFNYFESISGVTVYIPFSVSVVINPYQNETVWMPLLHTNDPSLNTTPFTNFIDSSDQVFRVSSNKYIYLQKIYLDNVVESVSFVESNASDSAGSYTRFVITITEKNGNVFQIDTLNNDNDLPVNNGIRITKIL